MRQSISSLHCRGGSRTDKRRRLRVRSRPTDAEQQEGVMATFRGGWGVGLTRPSAKTVLPRLDSNQ